VSNRKQTAIGFEVGARLRDWNPVPGKLQPFFPSRRLAVPGPELTKCQYHSRRQIFLRRPAQGRVCLCPERLRKIAAGGEQRTSVATSFALLAGSPAGAGGSSITMLLPLLLIPVLYLVMIRPQQKRQKQWQSMLSSIKAGDRITTAGGIRGIILSIKDDVIVIRVAPDGIKLEVAKNAIASVTTQDGTSGS